MSHWVYILYSPQHNRFYVGETSNLTQRLGQHNRGNVPSTAAYRPWNMVLSIEKPTRKECLTLEKKLKNLHSPKRLIAFIKKYGSWEFESSDDSENV